MKVTEAVGTGLVSVELCLPVEAARQAMCGSGRCAWVGFRPHLGSGAALELGCLLERVAVLEEAQQGMEVADWWGKLQHLQWCWGMSPDDTPKRLGVRVRGTEGRSAGDVGREGIALCLGFPVEGRKVRVRVHGHPSSFLRTAQADAHRLVGLGLEVVGLPTHLEQSAVTRPVFDVFLVGVPDDRAGGVLENPNNLKQPVKRWIRSAMRPDLPPATRR